MTRFERNILAGAVGTLNYWRSQTLAASYGGRVEGARHNRRRRNAIDHGVVDVDVAGWIGAEPTPAQRRAASRALESLEAAGMVVRLGGQRTTAIRILPAGETVAAQLTIGDSAAAVGDAQIS